MNVKKIPIKSIQLKSKSATHNATDKELSVKVLRKFRLVFNTVKTHFQQVEKIVGIGGAQVWALSLIMEHPGIGTTELAKSMDIHQTTASNLIKSLVKIEAVQIKKNDVDKRSVQVHLLPKGMQILEKVPGPFTGVLPFALRKLNPAVLKRLDLDLSKLLELIDSDEENAQIPLGVK